MVRRGWGNGQGPDALGPGKIRAWKKNYDLDEEMVICFQLRKLWIQGHVKGAQKEWQMTQRQGMVNKLAEL